MKKLSIFLAAVLLLAACGEEEATEPVKQEETVEETGEVEETTEPEEAEIDTTVFEYAQATEVIDSIDNTQYVTVFVDMSPELSEGLAVQHVAGQAYDFIQQEDLDGANLVSINVRQNDNKIAQFEIDRESFTPDENEAKAAVVMQHSTIDFMTDDVKAFGEDFGNW